MYFDKVAFILANVHVVWLHVNNCCKGAVACLYQEGAITGITFCYPTGGLLVGFYGKLTSRDKTHLSWHVNGP